MVEKKLNAYLNCSTLRGFNSNELATSDNFVKVAKHLLLHYTSADNKKRKCVEEHDEHEGRSHQHVQRALLVFTTQIATSLFPALR